MLAYQVLSCDCDGGIIGKTWQDWFFFDKIKANEFLLSIVSESNVKELNRTDDFIIRERLVKMGVTWWRLYREDTIDGIACWRVPSYNNMMYIKEIEIN